MEFKGTKGKLNLGYKTVKVNEASILFMPIYKTVVSNKIIAVAYSENGIESEVKANAQLIAHAPEMLEMLSRVIKEHETDSRRWSTILEIKDLLTRATNI